MSGAHRSASGTRSRRRRARKRKAAKQLGELTAVAVASPGPPRVLSSRAVEYVPPGARRRRARKPARPAAAAPATTSARSSRAPFTAGALLVLLGAAFAVVGGRGGPDPHLVRAREIVARYERGKTEEARDYAAAPYHAALAELDLVPRSSRSAREAQAFAADLRGRMDRQAARAREQSVRIEKRQEAQQRRDEEFFRAERMQSLVPPPPECATEGGHDH
jgi:hypothetical protein